MPNQTPQESRTNRRAARRQRGPLAPALKAGWSIEEFTSALGICREGFYRLDVAPESILLGNRRIVLEAPAAYLARIAAQQRAAA